MTAKKIDIATDIFNKNKDKPRADVIEKIMSKLSVTRGNASIYYAKAKDRADKPAPAAKNKTETGAKTETSSKKEDKTTEGSNDNKGSGTPSGKYANTKIREVITTAIEESDRSAMPAFLRASWEKHNF